VTTKALSLDAIPKQSEGRFYLFICNPHARATLPNVFTLKGVENLTDLNIALNVAFRRLGTPPRSDAPRRACLDIISDVLLQHHAVQTRRWLNALIPELKSHGFTTLAVMDPGMHPPEEVRAILDLFDGEISIYEKRSTSGSEKFLKIHKLVNQKYLNSERPLDKKNLRT
jgi:hypothetical protein